MNTIEKMYEVVAVEKATIDMGSRPYGYPETMPGFRLRLRAKEYYPRIGIMASAIGPITMDTEVEHRIGDLIRVTAATMERFDR